MSSEWETHFLDSLCQKITDGAHQSPKSVDAGKPMASVKDLTPFGVDLTNARQISLDDFDVLVKQGCQPIVGDVLIAKDGNSALDTVCCVDTPLDAVLLSSVAILRPNSELLDSHFLKHYLSSREVIDYLKSNFISGAAIPRVVLRDFKKAEVNLPKLKTQKAISAYLDMLDDRIRLLYETNATLEAIAQALFKSWFVDFDPVRAKAEGRLPDGIDAVTAALFPAAFEETELGMVPRGWQVDTLENFLTVLETGRRPKGGVAGIESGIPSIGAESVTKIGDFDYSKLKYVSAEFFETMKSGKLDSRDVLLYKDGGKPGVFLPRVSMFGDGFPFEICGINEHVFRIRVKAPLSQTFLYFWLWSDSVMHELKHRGGKAAIPGINQKDVKELKIAVPCDGVLTQFDTVTSPLISQILFNSKLIKLLSDLRDTLMPRLISGQLPIADAEAELEKAIA